MSQVSLIIHLHHPYHPARFSLQDQAVQDRQGDLVSTRKSLLSAADSVFGPLASMLGQVVEKKDGPGIGLTISGPLLTQLEQWAPDTLEAWQHVWRLPEVEILPQAQAYSPELLWDRDAWLRSLQEYRERVSLLGATLSPVSWNPGYLFIRYLAWPLQDTGIRGSLVDGDSFGWGGSMANRISRVPFQHSFRMLTRNSWWSQQIEQLNGLLHGPAMEAKRFLAELSACPDSPVVLSIDLSHWLSRPGLIPSGIEFLKILLEKGGDMGINWVSPGKVLAENEPVADWTPTDWVVLPSQRGLLNDQWATPVASDVMNTWMEMKDRGVSVPYDLIDTELLGSLDSPDHWVSPGLGKAGHVYSKLMGQLAAIQEKEKV